jgi:hypothetical protein
MYSKRAFVHWYVGEGMEEVSATLVLSCVPSFLLLFPRANFPRLVRISLHSRRITKRLVLTPLMLRRKVNTRFRALTPSKYHSLSFIP